MISSSHDLEGEMSVADDPASVVGDLHQLFAGGRSTTPPAAMLLMIYMPYAWAPRDIVQVTVVAGH